MVVPMNIEERGIDFINLTVTLNKNMAQCPHCLLPLTCSVVCRSCKEEVDPVKNYVLILIIIGVFVAGIALGAFAAL